MHGYRTDPFRVCADAITSRAIVAPPLSAGRTGQYKHNEKPYIKEMSNHFLPPVNFRRNPEAH
jgi:hypothetical protein